MRYTARVDLRRENTDHVNICRKALTKCKSIPSLHDKNLGARKNSRNTYLSIIKACCSHIILNMRKLEAISIKTWNDTKVDSLLFVDSMISYVKDYKTLPETKTSRMQNQREKNSVPVPIYQQ